MANHWQSLLLGEVAVIKLNFAHVQYIVKSQLLLGLLDIFKERVLFHPKQKKMWGVEQPTGFVRCIVTLALYKDLSGYGYQKILDSIALDFHINSKSFNHNMKLIRQILFE